ncbi:MAG: hypothetical protein AAB305_01235 [Candidatus Zixiibacteriota bacterium]
MRNWLGRPKTNHQRVKARLLLYHATSNTQFSEHAEAMADFVMCPPRRRRIAAAPTR